MSGILTTVRETWADFLRHDAASGAQAFFASAPAIPIYTEKLKSLEQTITNATKNLGLSVIIVTVTARGGRNNMPGRLAFEKIIAAARVYENPKINPTGLGASDLAEAIAWFTRGFKAFGAPMQLLDVTLGNDPRALCYDVLYTLDASTDRRPTRDRLADDDGTRVRDDDGTLIGT